MRCTLLNAPCPITYDKGGGRGLEGKCTQGLEGGTQPCGERGGGHREGGRGGHVRGGGRRACEGERPESPTSNALFLVSPVAMHRQGGGVSKYVSKLREQCGFGRAGRGVSK